MDWAAFASDATKARAADQMAQPPTFTHDPGAFQGFGAGVGNYFMRGLAETARNASLAGAVVPMAADYLIGDDNKGESFADAYFRNHDRVFQGAVDYWTPKPGTVGKAGEIVGQLGIGLLKFVANPAWAVADSQLSTSIDLTRAGVDTGAALVAGDLAGLSTIAGVALPFVGSTAVRKMVSGVAGNLVPNMLQAQATQSILKAAGAPDQAALFDPLDPTARGLDVLMGMAFGGAAHFMSKSGQRKFEFTDEQKNALLVANQARHLERAAVGDPTQHVTAMKAAIDEVLAGKPIGPTIYDAFPVPDAIKAEATDIHNEITRLASEDAAKPPIQRPDMQPAVAPPEANAKAPDATPNAKPALDLPPDLMVPTGEFDAQGNEVRISANDFLARAEADAAKAENEGNLYRTAAECLLGTL